jgi:hypothetical protein
MPPSSGEAGRRHNSAPPPRPAKISHVRSQSTTSCMVPSLLALTTASSGSAQTAAAPRGTSPPSTTTQAKAPWPGDASEEGSPSVRGRAAEEDEAAHMAHGGCARTWGTPGGYQWRGGRGFRPTHWHPVEVSDKRTLPYVLFCSNYE